MHPDLASRSRLIPPRFCLTWLQLMMFALLAIQELGFAAATDSPNSNARHPRSNFDLRFWLQNMVWYHRFSEVEMSQALGLSGSDIREALERFNITRSNKPSREPDDPILVLPYPGGRHPREGFLDGAVNPQRETKLSVFLPWDESSYVVLDTPEAIWSNLGLTYLAHTHVPTIWTKQDIILRPLEWRRRRDGGFFVERTLPNGIRFSTEAIPTKDAVLLEMKLYNGTEATLTDLRVQNCALLKQADGFNQQTNRNKIFAAPFAACKNEAGNRWLIYAWTPCHRPWANPPCPCLHSDPKFPDCPPGQTRVVRGWFSFYEGTGIQSELERIEKKPWLKPPEP